VVPLLTQIEVFKVLPLPWDERTKRWATCSNLKIFASGRRWGPLYSTFCWQPPETL